MANVEPIMVYSKSLITIRDNINIPEVRPVPTVNISRTFLHCLASEPLGISAADCSCKGGVCDKQRIFFGCQVKNFCSCFSNNGRLGNVVARYQDAALQARYGGNRNR